MTLDIYQLCGRGFDSNIYLLDTKKPILIDTGTGMHNNDVLNKLKSHDVFEELSKIVLTHNHADHSGGAAKLSGELDADVYAHKLDGAALADGNGVLTGATMFGFNQEPIEIIYINDGDTIDCGDTKLEVLHTPGHSPGSISLYDEESQTLICGDLVFMDGGVGRWDLPGGDYKLLVSSFERILELDIENFYPGHGPSNEGDAKKYIELSYKYLKSCAGFA